MDVKHTPAPWEIRVGFDVTGYPCYFIKGVSGDEKRNYERLEANAHIMAAAPELLEALKHVVAAERAFIEDTNGAWDDEVGRAVIAAEAVIRKAEGRSHG